MISLVGNLSLSLAVLVAALAVVMSLGSVRLEMNGLLRTARWLLAAYFALLTVSSLALTAALLMSDFSIQYVVHYTERALPTGYKLAAFWAGQDGSLLLWAWLLAAMSVMFLVSRRRDRGLEAAATVATLAVVLGFFVLLMLLAANPFTPIDQIPSDGDGLNPMLQDPSMIAHPPILFLGYAASTIPFAMLIGALAAKRTDNQWIRNTRRWAIAAWLFLSIGILLGAKWAYVVLGWGGYWAWDPVENASLLPWLTGTALLHSIMVQQHRGMLKLWSAALIAATFVLCIFGTYLTRSGVVSSVHAFGESLVGTFFLVFLLVAIFSSTLLLVIRQKVLRTEHAIENLLGKEALFLASNVLLVGMTVVTLVGTIFPIISRTLGGREVTVGPAFYNKVVAPLALLLTALMAVGPLLTYGAEASKKLLRGLVIPGLAAVVTPVVFWRCGLHNGWALVAVAIAALAISAVVFDLLRSIAVRARSHGENYLAATVQLLDANHRRYGGQVVHLGILLIVAGVMASSLFARKQTFQLKPGATEAFAGQTLHLAQLQEVRRVNYTTVQATITLSDGHGVVRTFTPERRFYDKSEDAISQVAIQSDWQKDYYLTLAGWEEAGQLVAVEAIVNPLVSWIWAGGVVLGAGAILCLLPPLLRRAKVAAKLSGHAVGSDPQRSRTKNKHRAFQPEHVHEIA